MASESVVLGAVLVPVVLALLAPRAKVVEEFVVADLVQTDVPERLGLLLDALPRTLRGAMNVAASRSTSRTYLS